MAKESSPHVEVACLCAVRRDAGYCESVVIKLDEVKTRIFDMESADHKDDFLDDAYAIRHIINHMINGIEDELGDEDHWRRYAK